MRQEDRAAALMNMLEDLQAEQERARISEARYREIFNATNEAIFIHEVETGRILDINDRVLEMFRCPREQIIGAQAGQFSAEQPELANAKARELIARAVVEGPQVFEWQSRRADGTLFWNEVSLRRTDLDGKVRVLAVMRDTDERKRMEAALERRLISLMQPLESVAGIELHELFNIDDLQRLQDEFSRAIGVASIITLPDGTPLTRPSNFCRLCNDIIRRTELGRANCYKSDAVLGRSAIDGPCVQTCMSGGLWDAAAGITVGGRHIGNWLIGQVRDATQSEATMRDYARTIGADEDEVIRAFNEVPAMSQNRFREIAQMLHTLAGQLSSIAYQNVQQARFITERKRVEEQLRVANTILRTQQETSLDGILVVNDAGRIISYNRRFVEMWRVPEDIVRSGSNEHTLAAVRDRLADPEGFLSKVRHLYEHPAEKSHDEIPLLGGIVFERYSAPMVGEQGEYRGRVWYFRDITERKQTVQALHESEERYRATFENCGSALMVVGADTTIKLCNRQFEELTGFGREELEGRMQWPTLVADETERRRLLAYHRQRRNGQNGAPHTYESRIFDRGGTLHHVLVSVAMLPDGSQSLAALTDVTEWRKTQQAMLESENLYRTIFENTGTASIIIRDDTVIELANSGFVALSGYSREELEGKHSWTEFVVPEDLARMKRYHVNRRTPAADGSVVPRVYEFRFQGRDGAIRHCFNYVVVIPGTTRSIASILDITERRQAEEEVKRHRDHLEQLVRERTTELLAAKEQAEAANRAKSTFLAKMSHELRTPLNAILGYAQILGKRELSADMRKGMGIIQQSGEHLLMLINDILNLSKIEAGKLELQPAPLALLPFLQEIIDIVKVRAEAKELRFTFVPALDLPASVLADATRLRQILLNLLTNAVKFTEQGGVSLQVQRTRGSAEQVARLRFVVEDSGGGIPGDQLERIFLPFEQGENLSRIEGTGLGLAISRQLAQLMGGELQVASEPGQGSRFWLSVPLPVTEATAAALPVSERQICGYDGPRRTLLIVDDILSNRAMLRDMLEPLGFQVQEAADGRAAVAAARELRPDLVLMDRYMPVLDGFHAAAAIHQLPGLQTLPIVAISASVSASENDERDQRPDCIAFVAKPVQWNELAAVLQEQLDLVWHYRLVTESSPPDSGPLLAADLVPLPAAELEIMFDLARAGDLAGIVDRAACIRAMDERYVPVADRLAVLAREFDEVRLLQLLQALAGAEQ
ncbi:MAG TPA: PAS domain S-box protein [bacterium]|nr:PAS domain S-box protein [bacterium]